MKQTLSLILIIVVGLSLLSLLTSDLTHADAALQVPVTPTVFVYLPFAAQNWSSSSMPTATRIPITTTLFVWPGLLESQPYPGAGQAELTCRNPYGSTPSCTERWTASLASDMVGNRYGIEGTFRVSAGLGHTIDFRIILVHRGIEQLLVAYHKDLPQGTWNFSFDPVEGPDPAAAPGDALIFEIERSQIATISTLWIWVGGGTGARIIVPAVTTSAAAQFREHTIDNNFNGAYAVYATDMDGDGDMDVLGSAYYEQEIAWWENDGNQSFNKHVIDSNLDLPLINSSVFATDIDGDGDVDVLGPTDWIDEFAWWENDGNENFTKHSLSSQVSYPEAVSALDLDGDRDVDILVGGAGVAWWQNDGQQNFSRRVVDNVELHMTSVYPIDLDKDGDVDILGATREGRIVWWENNGSENFTRHIIREGATATLGNKSSVFATDMDGDGDRDVIGTDDLLDDISWWENDGNENFTQHPIYTSFSNPGPVYAIDLDEDGDVDIVAGGDAFAWWENDGSQNFMRHIIGRASAASVYAVDIDGDGDVDVLSANGGKITWWENP